jgi:hypothetical protein
MSLTKSVKEPGQAVKWEDKANGSGGNGSGANPVFAKRKIISLYLLVLLISVFSFNLQAQFISLPMLKVITMITFSTII